MDMTELSPQRIPLFTGAATDRGLRDHRRLLDLRDRRAQRVD